MQGKGKGKWPEAHRRRRLQTATQPGVMPTPPPPPRPLEPLTLFDTAVQREFHNLFTLTGTYPLHVVVCVWRCLGLPSGGGGLAA